MGILFSKAPSSPCIRTNPEVLPFENDNNLSVANVEDINLQEKSPDKHSESSILSIDINSLNSNDSLILSESSDERLYDSDESLPDHVPELVEAIIQQENIQLVVGESGDLVEPIEQVEIVVEEQVVEEAVVGESGDLVETNENVVQEQVVEEAVVGESGDLVEPIEPNEIVVEEQVVEQPVIKEIHEEIEVDKVDEVAPAEPVIHENAEEDTREHKED